MSKVSVSKDEVGELDILSELETMLHFKRDGTVVVIEVYDRNSHIDDLFLSNDQAKQIIEWFDIDSKP